MQSEIKNKEERNMSRKDTKVVHIGDRVIGGGNPILIQSMCNTKTEDVKATVAQILSLEKARLRYYPCGSTYHEGGRSP